jgi:hypothetical protein
LAYFELNLVKKLLFSMGYFFYLMDPTRRQRVSKTFFGQNLFLLKRLNRFVDILVTRFVPVFLQFQKDLFGMKTGLFFNQFDYLACRVLSEQVLQFHPFLVKAQNV